MSAEDGRLGELVAEVAAAYFSSTHVNPADIPAVLAQIAAGLSAISRPLSAEPARAEAAPPETAKATKAQIRKSITPEALISFEDGKSYKMLRRHLNLRGLTPDLYREKWGLPPDYPMTAARYSETRQALAKKIGLGRKPGTRQAQAKG